MITSRDSRGRRISSQGFGLGGVLLLVLGRSVLHAGELSFQFLPQARMEYEGTGFREVLSGWELKVKPWSAAAGIRWRGEPTRRLAVQTQYWVNRPSYAEEFGNTAGPGATQTGQAQLFVQSLWVDVRSPLWGSSVEAVGGVNGLSQTFRQKDVTFHGTAEPGRSLDVQRGLGAYWGFHAAGGGRPGRWGVAPFWDSEILIGHFFWTSNRLSTSGGSVRRGGYCYAFRGEGGLRWSRWRASLGYTRQMYELFVPGGRRFTAGAPSSAVASLPINKVDFFGVFFALGWTYP